MSADRSDYQPADRSAGQGSNANTEATAEANTEATAESTAAAIWDACAGVISRADQTLAECALAGNSPDATNPGSWIAVQQCGPAIAQDLLSSVSAVCRVELLIGPPDRRTPLGISGAPMNSAPLCLEAFRDICDGYGCFIRIGVARETDRQPIVETADALAELLSNVAAKAILQDVLAFTKLTTDPTTAPSRSLHQIAELLARQLSVDRLSLVDLRRQVLVASSEQPHVDRKSDLAIEIVEFATQAKSEAEQNQFKNNPSERFVSASFCEGRVVAVAEMLHQNAKKDSVFHRPTEGGLGESCPPVFLACQAAIADALGRTGFTVIDRLKSNAAQSSWRRRVGCVAVILLALVLIPIPIQVKARGRLTPVSQHRIFASMQGEVKSVACEAGQKVRRGELLCQLTSYQLDSRETELNGQLLTVKEQLQVAVSNRGVVNAEMKSQRQVLEVRVESIQSLLSEIAERREELSVRSPMDGVVEFLFEDERQQVSIGRPVRPGQAMFRVIDPAAGFHAELDIPDDQIGYVVAARQQSKDGLRCVFRIRSSPYVDHPGRVVDVEDVARLGDSGELVVRSIIEPDAPIVSAKSETGLLGWVRCRSAPAGFVLFRRVIEAIRMRGG